MKKKVLIVDDEKDFGVLLKAYFSRKGFDVFISHTLADGMEQLKQINPDFLFLDNNLPDGLGWDKTEFILRSHPYMQLNLISAYRYDIPSQIHPSKVLVWEKPINLTQLNMHFSQVE